MNLSFDAKSPLLWWKEHIILYLNMPFLLDRSWESLLHNQIFLKKSMVGILTCLHCCKLWLTNLSALIMIYKNWPKDARVKDAWSKPF